MDAASISLILSQVLRLSADFSERAAAGTITHEDITKMLGLLGHTLDTWQAQVDAHKTALI